MDGDSKVLLKKGEKKLDFYFSFQTEKNNFTSLIISLLFFGAPQGKKAIIRRLKNHIFQFLM